MTQRTDSGMALIVAIMAMFMLAAIGTALLISASGEAIIAANYRASQEALQAADGAAERIVGELVAIADWNPVLAGLERSTLVDGPPSGTRPLADGTSVDLTQAVNMANCEKPTPCSAPDLAAATAQRPWGANNPVWQPFAYGRAGDFAPGLAAAPPLFVLVMIGDDPAENDGDPLRDGAGQANPGSGVVVVRAEAFGPRGVHRVVELTVVGAGLESGGRSGAESAGMRVLAWREVR